MDPGQERGRVGQAASTMVSGETEVGPQDAAPGDGAGGAGHELRSFGRRRGRKLSPRQQHLVETLLPRLAIDLAQPAPDRLADLLGAGVGEVWLEIGFGGGEHLLWQARQTAQVGIIGCEPFLDGLVKVLAAIDDAKGGLGNVRLHGDDARPLLRWLPDASLARAFILFPDPWPKARHRKRRLVSEASLRELARAMRPGAELRLATDISDYARHMLIAIAREGSFRWTATGPDDWRQRPPDWPPTRYEAKALREGRKPAYLSFARR
ncbi:MAG: tRNA (guanine(46)-N(7))-methyltransferase TrmB [Hyphomicrobiaceae bacterium]|nr:tRNA (guanine(46)-N(7))-methyltransferase TrmB [Hyphomicrobiaceae bacterium]